MAEHLSAPPISTFVIRFWHEWSATGIHWRGRVEHVHSGERATFAELQGMLDFIRSFGVMADLERPDDELGIREYHAEGG